MSPPLSHYHQLSQAHTCKYPRFIATQKLQCIMGKAGKYKQITPSKEFSTPIREGVEKKMISGAQMRLRKSNACNDGRIRQILGEETQEKRDDKG